MAKAFAVCTLCIVQGGPRLERAVAPKAAVAAPAEMNIEVLGDRVRCDVRYQELKILPGEYQSFKRKCMGANWDGD